MFGYGCLDLERGMGWGSTGCPAPEQFTDLAQRASGIAHEEATQLGHDYVGTEHLLLGVISCDSGLLSDLLRKWGIEADTIRAEIEKVVGPGGARKSARDLPYTPRARRALTLAMQETQVMGHSFITPEHIMLGLLLEKEGLAGVVLRGLGLDAGRARQDILNGLGPDGDDGLRPVLA
jgi:ATP-dependent Clp protease ATP-binding subunit ClpC